mgnify:CR=1 FL=1
MQPHINDLMPTFAGLNSMMKNCHPSPNWKVIYSTLMNHEDSPYLPKINATSTNTLTLPANIFITTQVALPLNKISLRDNNKLSARFFARITNKTTATDQTIDHPTDTRATNFQHQTVPTLITSTVEMLPLQDRIMELDHLNDQRPRTPTTNADRRIVQPRSGETHQQMLPTLYATIVEESVTMQDNAQLQTTDLRTPITEMEETQDHQPIMRTLLPEITELILSLIHLHLMLKQLITIKPSLLLQTTTLSSTMAHQQSGLTPTCLKWKSTHH